MDHPIAHPRNVVVLGLIFAVVAAIYLWVSHDSGGATMIAALALAMSLCFYALAAGSPRG